MIDFEWNGLPVHVLLVHLVIIAVPAAALAVLLSAFWPRAAQRIGIVSPLLALLAVVAVPITSSAGEWLQERVASTPLIQRHAELGPSLLPWVIALFVVSTTVYLSARLASRLPAKTRLAIAVLLDVAAVVVAVGAVVTVVLVGESGSAAVWTGSFS